MRRHRHRATRPSVSEPVSAANEDRRQTPALIVGHDGSPGSEAALRHAADLARRLGTHLHVVHSITLNDYGIDPDIDEFEEECKRNLAAERRHITEALEGVGVTWTYHEERGEPVHVLARLAQQVDAEMIVVGASAKGLLRHMFGLHDVVSQRLTHVQSHPVVVVPGDGAAGKRRTPVNDHGAHRRRSE